ncbi:hypothetical protein PENTCL1PPCAC_2999, partial [Pristionchus entomophagus]
RPTTTNTAWEPMSIQLIISTRWRTTINSRCCISNSCSSSSRPTTSSSRPTSTIPLEDTRVRRRWHTASRVDTVTRLRRIQDTELNSSSNSPARTPTPTITSSIKAHLSKLSID